LKFLIYYLFLLLCEALSRFECMVHVRHLEENVWRYGLPGSIDRSVCIVHQTLDIDALRRIIDRKYSVICLMSKGLRKPKNKAVLAERPAYFWNEGS
jgi:hypothetical protein